MLAFELCAHNNPNGSFPLWPKGHDIHNFPKCGLVRPPYLFLYMYSSSHCTNLRSVASQKRERCSRPKMADQLWRLLSTSCLLSRYFYPRSFSTDGANGLVAFVSLRRLVYILAIVRGVFAMKAFASGMFPDWFWLQWNDCLFPAEIWIIRFLFDTRCDMSGVIYLILFKVLSCHVGEGGYARETFYMVNCVVVIIKCNKIFLGSCHFGCDYDSTCFAPAYCWTYLNALAVTLFLLFFIILDCFYFGLVFIWFVGGVGMLS